MKDPYFDEQNAVLKNRLQISNAADLEKAEADLVFTRFLTVDRLLKESDSIDFSYLKKIHQYLFGEIYPFAGESRSIPIEKAERVLGGDTVRYAEPKQIEVSGMACIQQMEKITWHRLSLEDCSDQFTKRIAQLWQIHPFREGNTRTVMTFAAHFALTHGFSIDRTLFQNNSQYTRAALVKASDGQYAEYGYLKKIMKDAIAQGDSNYFSLQLSEAGFDKKKRLIEGMQKINRFYGKNISLQEIKSLYQQKNKLPAEERTIVSQVGNDLKQQEIKQQRSRMPELGPEP